jgi:hybrid polyketide synthase/nonribosomal peptide synthetase ACE1
MEQTCGLVLVLDDSGIGDSLALGVVQNPSADWICSMLAVLRVGATCVPLDLRN